MQQQLSAQEAIARRSTQIQIRWLIRRDMPEVLDIEQACFKIPWEEADFLHNLRQRNCIGMVAERDHAIVGFMIYELRKSKLGIINFAVRPDVQKLGIGRAMLQRLHDKLVQQKRNKIVVLLPESHRGASRFFEGYEDVEVHLTEKKGKLTIRPVIAAMSLQDASEVETMDYWVHSASAVRPERNIRELLAKGSCYGMVARDASTKLLLGFVLYERDNNRIIVDGDFGVVVDPLYEGRGIEDALMTALKSQDLPVTIQRIQLSVERIADKS